MHSHGEAESTALVFTIRVHRYLSLVQINQLLDDGETEPDAFVVHLRRPVQFSKPREQLGKIFGNDAGAGVTYMDDQEIQLSLETRLDHDGSVFGKFQCVFDEVDDNLLQMPVVPA